MSILRHIAIALLVVALSPIASSAQPKPGELAEILHQLDTASTKFKSAEADFRWDFYERVVKETTTQTGTIYFIKNGSKLEMGAKVAPPQAKVIEYKNGALRIFDPTSDSLTILDARKNQAQYESFLTLGFGGSGSDLAKAWTVSDLGSETLHDEAKPIETRKLDLVSKDPNVRNMFSHITIWVDPTRGISLKQQFFTPAGDYRIATYSNIRYNERINTKPYEIKTDKKTTIENH